MAGTGTDKAVSGMGRPGGLSGPGALGGFPGRRPRRLRRTAALRQMVRETELSPSDFIYPIFVSETVDRPVEVSSMPGVYNLPVAALPETLERVAAAGVRGILLFGVPRHKDDRGSQAYADDGVVQRALRVVKKAAPQLVAITDVCLCEYTDHGHCGVVGRRSGGGGAGGAGGVAAAGAGADFAVLNDPTLELLARTAVSHAAAGADVVAPSDMMDGRVGAIRAALDQAGHQDVAILAYAAKYASAFYGPFREAAGSTPRFGDRAGYQMDPANAREALVEVALDVAEGADMIMVKPALAYLDVIRRVREGFPLPLAAYNVSGEYAMIKAAARAGWLDERRTALEVLTAIKRAGADLILTYFALDAARWLTE